MSPLEDLLQAAMAAPVDRRKEALSVLRGRTRAVDSNMPAPTTEPYLTLRETAKRLGMSTATLWRWQIPGHGLGGRPRYKLSEVEAYLKSEEFQRRVAVLRAIRQGRQ